MLTYYNLVVDHNIQTPAGASPKSVYIGVKICNDGNNDMDNVFAYIGDYNNVTPGVYPTETPSGMPYSGTFSFTHEGGTQDATRFIGNLPGGECVTQYWLVSYPLVDANNNPVFGANSNQNDDLRLSYDVWASGLDNGNFREAHDSKTVQLRAQISASANKIWPNTTSHVPNQFLNAFPDKELGWRQTTNVTHPGASVVLEGIWFDCGTVNKGFDNNGDYQYDYNFMLQPIGDPGMFDANCFRLVKVSGMIVVKPKSGSPYSIDFVDQFHFENLPRNTGAVGMVFYEFAILNGPCSAELSPYQEAASGKNNEKFNADFGTPGGTLTSDPPTVNCTVTAPSSANPGDIMQLSISTENTTNVPIGMPGYSAALVFQQAIPSGLYYVAGSAANNNSLPAGTGTSMLYSTDEGATWQTNEPNPSTNVTHIKWVLDKPLQPGESAEVNFRLAIPLNYSESVIISESNVSTSSANPFSTCSATIVLGGGGATISDVVYADNGDGGAINGDALQTGGEGGLPNITVTLYNDLNTNGELDNGDVFVAQTQSAADGTYTFTDIVSGDYIVFVDLTDTDIPVGWINTTPDEIAFNSGSLPSSLAFGFTSIIELTNTLLSDPIVAEDDFVNYQVEIENLAYVEDTDNSSTVIAWASQLDPATNFNYYPNNLLGPPDVQLAWPSTWSKTAKVKGFDFGTQDGTIEKVEIILSVCLDYSVYNDYLTISFVKEDGSIAYAPNPVLSKNSTPSLNDYVGPPNIGWIILDVTDYQAWDWDVFDSNWAVTMDGTIVNSNDGAKQYTDAIGVRITSTCCASSEGEPSTCERVMDPLPLEYEYDKTKLKFISSIPEASSVSNGVVYFDDLGPVYPNEITQIDFTFQALSPSDPDETVTIAHVTQAMNCDGMLIIDADTAGGVSIENKGSVTGYVFGDSDGDGWKGITGYEPGVDNFIPGVEIFLYGCFKSNGDLMYPAYRDYKSCTYFQNGGHWELIKIDTTDENGKFFMAGIDNGYYYLEVDETSLTNAAEQTADPDRTYGLAGNYADKRWKDPNSACRDMGIIGIGNDHTNINFGYHIQSTIQGIVWNDLDGDGVKDANEPIISNVPVEFNHSGCTTGVNCDVILTNGDGLFTYNSAQAGVNYRLSLDMDNIQGADSWTITFEADGTPDNSNAITVAQGQQVFNVDFGLQAGGDLSLGGRVYYDWGGDAHQNSGDEGIPDIRLRLYKDLNGNGTVQPSDQLIATITTDQNGDYLFANKPSANYIITLEENDLVIFPKQTEDPDEYGPCVVCDAKTAITNQDFEVSVTDVWNYYNYNNSGCEICDEGYTSTNDPPYSNANMDIIPFMDPIGNPSACVTELAVTFSVAASDFNKSYNTSQVQNINYYYPIELNGVQIGTFNPKELPYWCAICERITLHFPVDLSTIPYNFGGANTLDVNFRSFNQALPSNQRQDICVADIAMEFIGVNCVSDFLSLDFAYQPTGGTSHVDGYAFVDANANAIYNAGEEKLKEVEVRLETDLNDDGIYVWSKTTVTDINGNFRFEELLSSNYRVIVNDSDSDIPKDYNGATYSATTQTRYDVDLAGGCEAQSDCDGIAQDAAYSDSKKEVKTLSYSHTTDSDANLLIVSATVNNNKSISTAQYNGIDLTLAKTGSFDGRRLYVYYLVDPPSGSHDVYISTGSGDKCDITVGSVSYKCVDTENVFPGGLVEQHGQLPGVQKVGDDISCIGGNYLLDFLVTDDDNVGHGSGQIQIINEDNPSDQEFLSTSIIQPDNNTSDIGWTLVNSEFVYIYGCLQPCVSSKLEFGFAKPGVAVGYIYSDDNGDGSPSQDEEGLGGVTVYICESTIGVCNAASALDTVISSIGGVEPLGFYKFTGLQAGTYTIAVDETTVPADYTLTGDPTTDGIPCYSPLDVTDENYDLLLEECDHQDIGINISLGAQYTGANFGYQPPGSIGWTVWFDDDEDGEIDDNEEGIIENRVIITNVTTCTRDNITFNPGEFEEDTYTNEDGNYVFTLIPDGTFDVTIDPPTDFLITYEPDGVIDSTIRIIVESGEIPNTLNTWCPPGEDCEMLLNFGLTPNYVNTISGVVCLDKDEDGRCDTGGETFPEGTEVAIYDLNGNEYGEMPVGADGTFYFDNLPTANMVIAVSKTVAPLRLTSLTTSLGDTPAYDIKDGEDNAIQFVAVSGNVVDMHYGFTFSDTFDLGDLPTPYLTRADGASSGPAHIIPASPTLYLGATIDAEPSPVLQSDALGDDTRGIDDEDGITFTDAGSWTAGPNGGGLTAAITGNGYLIAYADFNLDGDFDDSGEMFINEAVTDGTINYNFDIPVGTDLSGGQDIYFRFRLFKTAPFSPPTSYNGITEGGEVEDYMVSVCKNLTNAGTIAGAETGCNGYDPSPITVTTATSGGGGSIEYIWEQSTDGGLTYSIIAGETGETFDPSNIAQSTRYRRGARRSRCADFQYSNAVIKQVVSNYNDAGAIAGNEENCGIYDPDIILNVMAPSGGTGTSNPFYQWEQSTDGTNWIAILNANQEYYDPGVISVTTHYRRASRKTPCSGYLYSNVITKMVSVNYISAGTITGNESVCGTYDPTNITSVSMPSGGVDGYEVLQWQRSTNNGASWTDIPGATSANYNPGLISQTTLYRRKARRVPCSVWVNSNTVTKTVKPFPVANIETFPISASGFLCELESFEFNAEDAGPNVDYTWDFGTYATPNIALGQGPHHTSFDVPNNTALTSTTVTLTTEKDGCVSTDNRVMSFRPEIMIDSVVTQDPTQCQQNDGILWIYATRPPGTSIEYSINGGLSWTLYGQIAGQGAGVYDIRVRYQGGDCMESYGAVALSDPPPQADILLSTTEDCTGQTITIEAIPINSNPVFTWTFGNGAIPNTIAGPGPHSVYFTEGGFASIAVTLEENNCIGVRDTSIAIVANYSDGGTILGGETLCSTFDPANIVAGSNPSGGTGGTLVYQWEYREDDGSGGFTAWQDQAGANSASFDPGIISSTTEFRRKARRAPCSDWVVSNSVIARLVQKPNLGDDNYFTVCPGFPHADNVSDNDFNLVNPEYTLSVFTTNGTLDFESDGEFIYDPSSTYCGTDEFQYVVCNDGTGCCDTANVVIDLTDFNPPNIVNVPNNIVISCDDQIPVADAVDVIEDCQTVSIGTDEFTTQGTDSCALNNYLITRIWNGVDYCSNTAAAQQTITIQDQTAPDIYRIYTLPNGKRMVAGVMENVSNYWKTVSLPIQFVGQPVIFAQVTSRNDITPIIAKLRNISTTQFQLKLKEEEANDGVHTTENVAWVAFEKGAFAGSNPFEVGSWLMDSNPANKMFAQSYAGSPSFFASIQTNNEADPATVRTANFSSSGVEAWLEEETSADSEVTHNLETVGYLVMEGTGDITNKQGEVIGEMGRISLSSNSLFISLANKYHNPVVIIGALNTTESDAVIPRVTSVTTTGFTVQLNEWEYEDGVHGFENVSYLVVEGSLPLNRTVACDNIPEALKIGTEIIALDNCDATIKLIKTEDTYNFDCQTDTTFIRSWYVVDDCGNVTLLKETYYLNDFVPPTFVAPASLTIVCGEDKDDLDITGNVSLESDNCSAIVTMTYSDNLSSLNGCNGHIVRTWTGTDDCGNTTVKTQVIYVSPEEDTDGDGVVDYFDLDDDNDGIPDLVEGSGDNDGDNVPNDKDLDSDNDGIPDIIESGGTDTNGDGVVDIVGENNWDHDQDGFAYGYDGNDNDSSVVASVIFDANSVINDRDRDGIPNYLDRDSDNDAIPDLIEVGGLDTDGDGEADFQTLNDPTTMTDNDHDGFYDVYDPDDDGIPGVEDPDDPLIVYDGENYTGSLTSDISDSDGDEVPDFLDSDSDNDGTADLIEVGGIDMDGDGRLELNANFVDLNNDGFSDIYEAYPLILTDGDGTEQDGRPEDTNGDGTVFLEGDADLDGSPNHTDHDSDNDNILDILETGQAIHDGDNDGMWDNWVDTNNNGFDDIAEATGNIMTEGDGNTPDGRAEDSGDADDSAYLTAQPDGTFAENNGNPDVDDDGDGILNFLDTDSDNDLIPDNIEDANHNNVQDPDETGLYNPDSDFDQIIDGIEDKNQDGVFNVGETDPLNPNTDGDEFDDGEEDLNFDGIVDAIESDPTNACDPIINQACRGIALNIKLNLMGALIDQDSFTTMRDDLRYYGELPEYEPYSGLPHIVHIGVDNFDDITIITGGGVVIDTSNGGGTTGNPNVNGNGLYKEHTDPGNFYVTGLDAPVDWVLVELRPVDNRDSVIATRAGLLQRDGDVRDVDGLSYLYFYGVPSGNYFVSVRHRNHLGIITASSYLLSPAPTFIDFTDPTTPVNGEGADIEIDGKMALWAGDMNGDGLVIYQGPWNDVLSMFQTVIINEDNHNLLANFIVPGYDMTDFNMDGKVIFQGPNNDKAKLLINATLASPENILGLANFVIIQKLP